MTRFAYDYYSLWASESAPSTVTLPIGGVFLLQSALSSMLAKDQWIHDDTGLDLSASEWNTLDATLAALIEAILTEETPVTGTVPIGAVMAFPFGLGDDWLACDGKPYNRVDYPDLYAILPAVFILDADRLITPDLQKQVIQGSDKHVGIGDTGGEAEVTLVTAEIPAHNHAIANASTGFASGDGTGWVVQPSMGWHHANISIQNTGSGGAHENRAPFVRLYYWMLGR